MPVGKESIKRAASAEKKTSTAKKKPTTRTAKTGKAEVKAAEQPTVNVIAAPSEEVVRAVVSNKAQKPVGIKDELPIYLL